VLPVEARHAPKPLSTQASTVPERVRP